jgi:2'-5' RNA ligase
MNRRIFIAINLPQKIKEELKKYQNFDLPIKWVKKENFHITLVFLGYIKDENLPKVIEVTQKVASKYHPFQINIVKVSFAPPKTFPPKMIWAICEKSEELLNLKEDLFSGFSESKIPFLKEEKKFFPHITLGRISKWEFKRLDPEQIPEIDEDIFLSFNVNSVDVMESHLKRGGAEYTILKAFSLT